LGVDKDFGVAWSNFFTAFNNGRTRLASKPEKLSELIIIGNETKKTLEELKDNLVRFQAGYLGQHITHRGYSKAMVEWINYVNKCITDLDTQIRIVAGTGEQRVDNAYDELVDKWWNATGGLQKELEGSMKLLNEIIGIHGAPVMTDKLRDYLYRLRKSQEKFLNALGNLEITTLDKKSFTANFEPLIRRMNLNDVLNSQKEFLDLVRSFDAILLSERAVLIPKIDESYEKEFKGFYSSLNGLSSMYKESVRIIDTYDLRALMQESMRMCEKGKIIPK